MFQWKKLGKVFTPQEVEGRAWLQEFAQAPATLVFDDFVRVYFSCRPKADAEGQYVSYSAFVDLDCIELFKIRHVAEHPILSLGGRENSTSLALTPFLSFATVMKCAHITPVGRVANPCRLTSQSAWLLVVTVA